MGLSNAIAVFWISLLALPLSYVLNTVAFYGKDQRLILIAGAVCLVLVATLPQIILRQSKPQRIDPYFHVISLLTFHSITSLIIGLENDGLIAEFLGYFLRDGAPYMKTAYGTMTAYWDGIGHMALYMMMMAAITWNQTFYDVGLYWVGSFGHRMLVLIVAVAMGPDGLGWVFMMQIPYMAIFLWAGLKFIKEKKQEGNELQKELVEDDEKSKICISIWRRPLDVLFVLFYFCAGCFTLFRFIGAMGGNSSITKYYTEEVEPYLMDRLPFSKAEIMVQTFYFIPYYGLSIFALLVPGQSWLPYWALIYAGAAGQGQFAYIGASFHYRTPYIYRVPQTLMARTLFWLFNTTLLVVPHLAAYNYNVEPGYFLLKAIPENVDACQNSNGKSSHENLSHKKIE